MITLRKIYAAIGELRREVLFMSDTFQTELAQLQTDVGQLRGAVDTAKTVIQGIPDRIAQAVADAQAKGASPEQLQALHELHQSLQAETGDLQSVLTNATQGGGSQASTGDANSGATQQPASGDASTGATTTDPSSGA